MANHFNHRALAVSQQVYGWLLRAYPPAHRAEYGPAMAQLFRDQCRDEWSEARGWGLTKLWLRVVPDLVSTSIRERLAALKERKTMNDKIASLSSDRTTPTAIFIRVFIGVFLVTVIAATLITFILPETYASTARIKVENDVNDIASLNSGQTAANSMYDPYFIQTTFEIIQSQLVLSNVVAKLNLNDLWGKKYYAGETLKPEQALAILKQRLELRPVRNTKLISITVYSEDRNEASQIANAIAESYRDYRMNTRAELMAKGIAAQEQQYKLQAEQIHAAQVEVESLRQQFKIAADATASLSAQEQPYWDKRRDLAQRLDLQKRFSAMIEGNKLDAKYSKISLVEITDRAEPGRAPVKPNKALNITIGVVAGGFLGLMAGGASALLAAKLGIRGRNHVISV